MLMNSKTSTKTNWKQMILGFVLLAICVIIGGYILVLFWRALSQSQPEIAVAIIGGGVTILVSVFSLVWSKRADRQMQIEEAHREHKVNAYEEFLEFIFKLFVSNKSGKQLTEKEMVEFLSKFNQKMIVWGSDSVLKEFSNFRRVSLTVAETNNSSSTASSNPQAVLESMISLEKMLYAIRVDVGHNNKNLIKGDLLSLFITDIDEYLKMLPN